jgi:valyl-tRNA synthetase
MPEIQKTYEPGAIEERWYAFWQSNGCFAADPARVGAQRPAYSIVIPPPNVTGVLTLGHVLNNTIQDILARRARMLGREVLWLPGTDHAGIATQNVVEKTLRKEGAMRHRDDLGREVLVEKIWEWKEKYGGIIIQQLKKLGASCDWSRERFTMDADYSRCVQQVFVDLHRKGLIYRGKRMVNWCPASLTALSDEEVEMKPQQGELVYFRVEVIEEPGRFLTIATTRPETIPGDTAVAVNPKDERYAGLIGRHVRRPLPVENQAPLPIVGDDAVAFDFGTGVLKVTPAHDKADFEIGQRHGLEAIDIMHPHGVMNAFAGRDLAGFERFAARKRAIELLSELGAIEKTEPYQNNVGFSERASVPIEPRLSEQWFLRYPSREKARECVASGALRFFPERWAKVYDHWMENLQDWCISRQLWWGHRIPVWYRGAEVYCGLDAPEGEGWVQEADVLDTWFSSWLWPFATMGWTSDPERDAANPTLRAFYPTTDLVTGPDIIFFWVARMIMAGYEWMGEMPFRTVYFTGIIRDKQGRKMSKSLGNSPDPLDLIARYGADALRFGVMRSAPLGADVVYDEKNIELGRNFCTKLWNAARFRQMQGGESEGEIDPARLTADDRWILLRLDAAVAEVSAALEDYRFSDATSVLHRFFWSEFCDWYLEAAKAALAQDSDGAAKDPALAVNTLAVLDFVLSHTLRLFHPYLPFITEELWQGLGFHRDLPADQGGQTLMTARWPKPLTDDERAYFGLTAEADAFAAARYAVVETGRGLRRDFNIASSKRVRFVLRARGALSTHDAAVLKLLLNAEPLEIVAADWQPAQATPASLTALGELFLPLEGLVDVAAERERLAREAAKVEAELAKVKAKLEDANFAGKVPAAVLEEHRQRKAAWEEKANHIEQMLRVLG